MSNEFVEYEKVTFTLPDKFPSIRYSTLVFQRLEPFTAIVKGEIFFDENIRMRVLEVLDFDDKEQFIQSYSYEVYNGDVKLYWYDSFPHPHLKDLASTHPHHKHVPPDMKHNRVPAPSLSFKKPNLPFLIKEIESSLL